MGQRTITSLFLLSLLIKPLSARDIAYDYRRHPAAISQALLKCPKTTPKDISCDGLSKIAKETADLMEELERDPQRFGLNILRIQENIAQQTLLLQNPNVTLNKRAVLQQLIQNQQHLTLRLTLIRSLESPEGIG